MDLVISGRTAIVAASQQGFGQGGGSGTGQRGC